METKSFFILFGRAIRNKAIIVKRLIQYPLTFMNALSLANDFKKGIYGNDINNIPCKKVMCTSFSLSLYD